MQNHQADSPLYVWPDVWSANLQVHKSMVIHNTECPYWDQVSLNNTNQTIWFTAPVNVQIIVPIIGQFIGPFLLQFIVPVIACSSD